MAIADKEYKHRGTVPLCHRKRDAMYHGKVKRLSI